MVLACTTILPPRTNTRIPRFARDDTDRRDDEDDFYYPTFSAIDLACVNKYR